MKKSKSHNVAKKHVCKPLVELWLGEPLGVLKFCREVSGPVDFDSLSETLSELCWEVIRIEGWFKQATGTETTCSLDKMPNMMDCVNRAITLETNCETLLQPLDNAMCYDSPVKMLEEDGKYESFCCWVELIPTLMAEIHILLSVKGADFSCRDIPQLRGLSRTGALSDLSRRIQLELRQARSIYQRLSIDQTLVDPISMNVSSSEEVELDGTYPPDRVHYKGKTATLAPLPFKLVQAMWRKESMSADKVIDILWEHDSDKTESNVSDTISRANKPLLDIAYPKSLGIKAGFVLWK